MVSMERVEREIEAGARRAVKRAAKAPGRIARLGTGGPLRRLCREQPWVVRETVEELALMRAGYQRISYRKAVRQLVEAQRAEARARP